jgi:hypothetical protein
MKTDMTAMKNAIVAEVKDDVKQICRDELKEMDKRISDLEQSRSSGIPMKNSGPRKEEILDVVVKGFKEKQKKDAHLAEIENMVKMIMGDAHNIVINVPDDPCNHGILSFEDNTKKLEFYQKVEEKGDELDDNISFTNKVSWSDRVVEKKLGFIKFHLMAQFKKNVNAVKIYWRKRLVEMDGKKVASYNHENDEWVFYKSAKLVEPKVKDSMELWLSKRETNDPPSESE